MYNIFKLKFTIYILNIFKIYFSICFCFIQRLYLKFICLIYSKLSRRIYLDHISNMFTVLIMEYSVNKLESQWGWSSHITLHYLHSKADIGALCHPHQCSQTRFFFFRLGETLNVSWSLPPHSPFYNCQQQDHCSNKDQWPWLYSLLFMQASLLASAIITTQCWSPDAVSISTVSDHLALPATANLPPT